MNLNQTEKDFIEFISERRNCSYKEIENIYLVTKNRFKFSSSKYRRLCDDSHNLFKIMYGDKRETELIDSYRFHSLMHLFRFVSYSYAEPATGLATSITYYFKALIKVISKGDFKKLSDFLKRKISYISKSTATVGMEHSNTAKLLVGKIDETPVVVDYGCGLGYVSFEIGKLNKNSKVYLVDIDCLTLKFAEFRFKKHGINVETIPIRKTNLYPKLPMHNICIATSVMEHVIQPLKVYQNIKDSLKSKGIIYGTFEDTIKEMFHVSPDLSELRYQLNKDFKEIDWNVYQKIQ